MQDPMIGRLISGRYRIESFTGEGGMSRVWCALDSRTGHRVAIKILKSEYNQDTEFLERFEREAQAASLMNHHNIVNLLDVGAEDGMRYLIFEYIDGSTLSEIIHEKGKLPYNTAIAIALRILSALQHAHDRGIIHRDIKPQNILINTDGMVKVTDFGIARMANVGTLSKDNMVLGSVHYSSPEQASGLRAEPPSDLYSTGIVLYEMLTGHVPFTGENAAAVALQQVRSTPPPIESFTPEVPAAVIAVVMKALEKKPENRFVSANEMALALNDAMNGKLDTGSFKFTPSPSEDEEENQGISKEQTQKYARLNEKKLHRRIILAAVMLLMMAGVLFLVFLTEFRQVTVPDVLDLTVEEAEERLRSYSLECETESVQHATIAKGSIVSQSPNPDEIVKKGSTVILQISSGPSDTDLVPNVTNLDTSSALAVLKEREISNIVIVKTASILPKDTVISQQPVAGSEITENLSMELTVSGGSTVIPQLVGMTHEEATQALAEVELTEGSISYQEVSADQVGIIVAQSPAAGATAVQDAAIALTIGVESQPYTCSIPLSIDSDSEKDRELRIVLIKDQKEYVKYQATIFAGEALETTIPLNASVNGELVCRAYLDDQIYIECTLEFQ